MIKDVIIKDKLKLIEERQKVEDKKLENKYLILTDIIDNYNDLVIDDCRMDIVKLLGFCYDEFDYFYYFQKQNGDTYFASCVMGFTKLKGTISYNKYSLYNEAFNKNLEFKG